MTIDLKSSIPDQVDVIIIGAGAAGLMCAARAGQRGRKVLLIDHANKVGKKILMSGGGRCNFTNMYTQAEHFISSNPHFCKSALSRYTPQDFIQLVEQYNIPYHEKKLGQLFCDHSAKDILNMLLEECRLAEVKIRKHCRVNKIEYLGSRYEVQTSLGTCVCSSLVIATGGLSIPSMGATGFGYEIAKQFNISVTDTQAALVPFTASEQIRGHLAMLTGSSVAARVTCHGVSFTENILFTHRGLSGPAMLQISSYWNPNDCLEINLLPNNDLLQILDQRKQENSRQALKTIINTFLSKKIVQILFALWFPNSNLINQGINQIADAKITQIANHFHAWNFVPSGTEGYRTAEVTLGGVSCDEISSKTMEAKRQKGLYFIGEVLDVTGHLGGFNFQWAWASAVAAGKYV